MITRKGLRRRLRKAGFKFRKASKMWSLEGPRTVLMVPEHLLPEAQRFVWEEVSMYEFDKGSASIPLFNRQPIGARF